MDYKGIEYQLVETTNPCCWKWTVLLDATRMRTGIALTRADAVLDAERAEIENPLREIPHEPRKPVEHLVADRRMFMHQAAEDGR